MIWVTWRQHRTTILTGVSSVLLLTVAAVLAGLVVRTAESPAMFGEFFGCVPGGGSRQCWAESTLTLVSLVTVLLPVVLGLLVGVTVFSRDLERGTHVLGLSQSVSRSRWYWMRVLVVFVPVTAAVVILGSVLGWARSPLVGAKYFADGGYGGHSPLTFPLFQSTGIVAGAYTFLALILGSCAALFLRNTIGAMCVTLVAMSALLVGFQAGARPHYATATVESRPLISSTQGFYTVGDANLTSWLIYTGYVDADGRSVAVDYPHCESSWGGSEWAQLPDETRAEYEARYDALAAVGDRERADCLRANGADHFEIRSHPESLLRRFQLIEAALALALAALLFIPSLWALRRLRP